MVDDVEVWGCDVYGTTPIIKALAYARPTPVCETTSYLLDGTGTFAHGCQAPLTYQWYEDGSPIAGATSLQYPVPASHAPGTFSYTLEATCSAPTQADMSDPVSVQVVQMPAAVPGDSFRLSKTTANDIFMTWGNVGGATLYTIYRGLDPTSTFTTVVTTGPDGGTGVLVPLPTEPAGYYLVAGRNDTCGEGPKR